MKDLQRYETGTLVFGDWKITEEIGSGSYGTVYKIEKTEYGITADAALKVIRIPKNQSEIRDILSDGMDEKSMTSYFQGMVDSLVREIAVMSTLKSHPNIVTYENHKVMTHPGTVGWDILIQMELLTPLRDYQAKCAMTEEEVRRLAADMCNALVFCQKKALIHRDIKPQNIFVSEAGQFKLGDFGVARTMDKTVGSLSKQGTEDYMAPEVYRGQKYGPNVDLYSLGLVLYRLMNNNRLPFMPAAPKPIGFGDRLNALADRIGGEKPMTPPCNASPEFARIILKACAHDPKDRYQTAAEMLEELKNLDRAPWGEKPFVDPEPLGEEAREDEEEPGTIGPFGRREAAKLEPEDGEGETLGPFGKRTPREEPEEPKEEPAPKKKGKGLILLVAGLAAVCVAVLAFAAGRSAGESKPAAQTKVTQPKTTVSESAGIRETEGEQVQETTATQPEEYTDEDGKKHVCEYDSQGNLAGECIYRAEGELLEEITYTTDGEGNAIKTWSKYYSYSTYWSTVDGKRTEYGGYSVYAYDSEGKATGFDTYNAEGVLESRSENTYDADGNVSERKRRDPEGTLLSSVTYTYDADGNVAEGNWYEADGSLNYRYVNTYGTDGSRTGSTYYFADGSTIRHTYNTDGKLVKYEDYSTDGTLDSYFMHTYDASGNCIETDYYRGDGTRENVLAYTFDADGNTTKAESWYYNEDGTLWQHSVYTYTADGTEEWMERYGDDGTLAWQSKNWYDTDGNRIESENYDADGTLEGRYRYSYDANGNQIKREKYSASGKLEFWFEYTYDANGETTKDEYYDADGTLESWTEYVRDDSGRTTERRSYKGDGTLSSKYTYAYDADGNEIRVEYAYYSSKGVMDSRSIYFKDANGNTIKKEYYYYDSSDGTLKYWTETTYDENGEDITVKHYPDE